MDVQYCHILVYGIPWMRLCYTMRPMPRMHQVLFDENVDVKDEGVPWMRLKENTSTCCVPLMYH